MSDAATLQLWMIQAAVWELMTKLGRLTHPGQSALPRMLMPCPDEGGGKKREEKREEKEKREKKKGGGVRAGRKK